MLNVDTHVLIDALRGDPRPRERRLLATEHWSVAAIVLWELAKLSQLGRISLDLSSPAVETALSSVHVWPLDLDVARTATRLSERPGRRADRRHERGARRPAADAGHAHSTLEGCPAGLKGRKTA